MSHPTSKPTPVTLAHAVLYMQNRDRKLVDNSYLAKKHKARALDFYTHHPCIFQSLPRLLVLVLVLVSVLAAIALKVAQ